MGCSRHSRAAQETGQTLKALTTLHHSTHADCTHRVVCDGRAAHTRRAQVAGIAECTTQQQEYPTQLYSSRIEQGKARQQPIVRGRPSRPVVRCDVT